MAKRATNTVIQNNEPYAKIVGEGKRGYRVEVYWNSSRHYPTYERYFWYGQERAEKWAERKLEKLKAIVDHSRFQKQYTY